MTQLTCDNCGEPVSVEKRVSVGLLLTCECDGTNPRSIKTAMVIPKEWST